MANRWGNNGNSDRLFSWASKSLHMVTEAMKLKDAYSLEGSYDQPRQHIKKQRHYFINQSPSSQGYGPLCMLSHFGHIPLCDPMDCSTPGSALMGFSRQEYWSGLPFPFPESLPDPGVEPTSLMSPAWAGGFFTPGPPGKP